ncbi:unnamed protein product [Peniophora sp. CBMAI 1063]|nr:unnamed protein product [Peniophora sp. CBMAI 1063]
MATETHAGESHLRDNDSLPEGERYAVMDWSALAAPLSSTVSTMLFATIRICAHGQEPFDERPYVFASIFE